MELSLCKSDSHQINCKRNKINEMSSQTINRFVRRKEITEMVLCPLCYTQAHTKELKCNSLELWVIWLNYQWLIESSNRIRLNVLSTIAQIKRNDSFSIFILLTTFRSEHGRPVGVSECDRVSAFAINNFIWF